MEPGKQFESQRPAPVYDPHGRNAQAHSDDFRGPYNTDHSQHSMNPGLAKHGFGESPCGYAGCKNHDEDFMNRLYKAETAPSTRTTIDFNKVKPHGMEASIDWGHVKRLKESPREKPVIVYHHPETDTYHIGDGHHGVIADKLTGRPSVADLRTL